MPWDTEATRRKLLAAGTRQFAAHGFAGARVDAIAQDAGVNKERVYQYFGDKQGLFERVLAVNLGELLNQIAFTGRGAAAAGAYAGSLFDHYLEHPGLARLLAWESLELGKPVAAAERRAACAEKARGLREMLPGLGKHDAEQLLLSIISLTTAWWALCCVAEVVLTSDAMAQRREALVRQVTALAREHESS